MKKTGKQNLLCRGCGLQFQAAYRNKEADLSVKQLVIRMLLRCSGVRYYAAVLEVALSYVLATILKQGRDLEMKPKHRTYDSVQIDEQWSYVKEKKKKVWMSYAICAGSGEILAASWGKRNKAGVRRLMMKLKGWK